MMHVLLSSSRSHPIGQTPLPATPPGMHVASVVRLHSWLYASHCRQDWHSTAPGSGANLPLSHSAHCNVTQAKCEKICDGKLSNKLSDGTCLKEEVIAGISVRARGTWSTFDIRSVCARYANVLTRWTRRETGTNSVCPIF